MNQAQANRLVQLMNIVEQIPENHFNLNHWADDDHSHDKKDLNTAIDCGTSACAVGWAVIGVPVWKRHFILTEDGDLEVRKNNETTEGIFAEVGKFLGIEESEANWLFDPSSYIEPASLITPKQVVKRCAETLNEGGFEREFEYV